MRKVASKNTVFCADKAKLFENLLEEDLSSKEKRKQMLDFENCLGKHTDSLEHGLEALSRFMAIKGESEKNVFEHAGEVNTLPGSRPVYEIEDRGEQYLLSQMTGNDEPVYDTPKPRAQKQ